MGLGNQSQKDLEQIRQLVSRLHLHLNVQQYELEQEQNILKQLEQLKSEIEPMEKVEKIIINVKSIFLSSFFIH